MAMAKIVMVAHKSEWGNTGLERGGGRELYCREGQCSERREVRGAEGGLRELRAAGAIFVEGGGRCRGRCCRAGHKVTEGGTGFADGATVRPLRVLV